MDTKTDLKQSKSPHDEITKPSTIMRNVYAAFPSFAMLAGMQLDVYTPLKDGLMEAKTLANALDVQEDKLTPLLYSLVVAGLLKIENKSFSNTPEADKFLARGNFKILTHKSIPYMGVARSKCARGVASRESLACQRGECNNRGCVRL